MATSRIMDIGIPSSVVAILIFLMATEVPLLSFALFKQVLIKRNIKTKQVEQIKMSQLYWVQVMFGFCIWSHH